MQQETGHTKQHDVPFNINAGPACKIIFKHESMHLTVV